jgi:WD40 repeat protein
MKLSLGMPSVRNGIALIGTDDGTAPSTADQMLLVVDINNIGKGGSTNRTQSGTDSRNCSALKSFLLTDQAVNGVEWLDDDTIVMVLNNGDVRIVDIDTNQVVTTRCSFDNLLQTATRELAFVPNSSFIAVGGQEKKLRVIDLMRRTVVMCFNTVDEIGSVKVRASAPYLIGCTTDMGEFFLLDRRMQNAGPGPGVGPSTTNGATSLNGAAAVHVETKLSELYSHEMIDGHNVLLGFGNGELQHVDLRYPLRIANKTKDPFVEAIGHIDYSEAHGAIVTSGLTDFSVWNQSADSGIVSVWSSSQGGTQASPIAAASHLTHAKFLPTECSILQTDSSGYVSLYDQHFM